jgi:1,4-dihydroxy-6-naphthoate synthase
LGGIVIKRELGDDVRAKVERVLRRSIEYAFANPMLSRDYVKAHAQELEDDVIDKHIALFVNDFSLSLGEQGCEAIRRLTGLEEM